MKNIRKIALVLALAFFFGQANAQKITLSTLEQLSTELEDGFDSATIKLGFEYGNYAKGKDSAQITYEQHNTTMVNFSTNNAALYKQIKDELTKNGYVPEKGNENTEVYSRFQKKSYNISFIAQYSVMNPFKYHIGIQYYER